MRMAKDLTTSQIARQNILNNDLAVNEIQNQTGIQGIMFDGRLRLTKSMTMSNIICRRTFAFSLSANNIAIFRKALKSNIAICGVLLLMFPTFMSGTSCANTQFMNSLSFLPFRISYPFEAISSEFSLTYLSIVLTSTSKYVATIDFVNLNRPSNIIP